MIPFTTEDIITNDHPSRVWLNNVLLPEDVIIGGDFEKVVAESKILDGASVFERICRKPIDINLEFTIREKDASGNWIFPIATIQSLFDTVWQPDQVVPIKNSLLNALHINYVVIISGSFTTFRGNTNVIETIKCKESPDSGNVYGTLIIPV